MKEIQILLYVAFTYLVCSICNSSCEAGDNGRLESLKLVQIIFRHGDRHWDTSYDVGDGLLTYIGKNQEFELGLYFRERYGGLISKDYQDSEIEIISSSVSRCVQSSQLVTYGLYKEFHENSNWSQQEKIQFEPIPFRTIPKKTDNLLQQTSECPRSDLLYNTMKDEIATKYFTRNADMIEHYSKHSGETYILDENIRAGVRLGNFIGFQEQLIFNSTHNVSVADWTLQLLNNSEFLSMKTQMYRYINRNQERQKLTAGPLIELLIENMEKQDTDNLLKLILFSAHDKTILNK